MLNKLVLLAISIVIISGCIGNEAQKPDTTVSDSTTTIKRQRTTTVNEIKIVGIDDDPRIGPEDATVTIIEFSDFQCGFCAKASQTVKDIIKRYPNDVRYVYRDFPSSYHENAFIAAEAADCANEQGKFWEYHDKLFENQNSLDKVSLKRYASQIGLNTSQFDQCLDSEKYREEVEKDISDGEKAGVEATPTFFINGDKIVGAQPYYVFKEIIDSKLGK